MELKILSIIEEFSKNEAVEFFLGDYGDFDKFAYLCAKKYQKNHTDVKLVFVTPYIDESYLKQREDRFDETLFPDLESIPYKLRILKRNEYMIDKTDLVIAYVTDKKVGGSYKILEYAKRKSKNIINLA